MKYVENSTYSISETDFGNQLIGVFSTTSNDNDTTTLTSGFEWARLVAAITTRNVPMQGITQAKFLLFKADKDVDLVIDGLILHFKGGKYNKLWCTFSTLAFNTLDIDTRIVLFVGA